MKRVFFFAFLMAFLFSTKAYSATHYLSGANGPDTIEAKANFRAGANTILGYLNGSLVWSVARSTFCDAQSGTELVIDGYGSYDKITVHLPPDCHVYCDVQGGGGDDKFYIKGCENATIVGGPNHDEFYLGSSSQYFSGSAHGGDGPDYFNYYLDGGVLYGGGGPDLFEGNVRSGTIVGGGGQDLFIGGPNWAEANGIWISSGDSIADSYVGFGTYYTTIYCDAIDNVDNTAYVFQAVGGCI